MLAALVTRRHKQQTCHLSRFQNPIYTTSVLGTAPLNFGTRAANLRHGTPELCRVNAYLWARVPKNPGGPSTPEIGSLGPPVWSAVPEFEWVLDRFLVILLEGLEIISIEPARYSQCFTRWRPKKTACSWSRGINWAPEATETPLDL